MCGGGERNVNGALLLLFRIGERERSCNIHLEDTRGKGMGWIVMNSVGAFKNGLAGTEWSGLIKGRDLMDW